MSVSKILQLARLKILRDENVNKAQSTVISKEFQYIQYNKMMQFSD